MKTNFSAAAIFVPIIISLFMGYPKADESDSGGVLGNIPEKINGQWPNDARDTFWYSNYETAARVAKESQRPILMVINRGAVCEV